VQGWDLNLESSRDVTHTHVFFRKHEIETMRALYPRSFNKQEGEMKGIYLKKGNREYYGLYGFATLR